MESKCWKCQQKAVIDNVCGACGTQQETATFNLIELVGMTDLHLILVHKEFDLNKDNDEMLNVDWDNEPIEHHEFFTVTKLLKFCQENDVSINKTYYGKIY